ncbi:MAG: lipoprotein [Candidatus Peregrinibacteria bacterium Gr01-1014_25]|nr:MAG: lipoprotein [Candidatus Peregrinibacteria bacterium Gr01-1014_25]
MATVAVTALVSVAGMRFAPESLQGLIVQQERKPTPWIVYDQADVATGVSVPADTHVVFHLPDTLERISLDVLFGYTSDTVRFWGYCLPANYEPEVQAQRMNLPGQLFLSKKERAVREAYTQQQPYRFSLLRLPRKEDIIAGTAVHGRIRHEVDVFEGSTMCYVMSELSIPLGVDADSDGLNTRVERDSGTRPELPDTDADGILDGVEYRTGTNPTQRDSDVDGLIDGIEDKDWDGRVDRGETNPRTPDSDRDDLCDGLCLVKLKRQKLYIGEDRNLNGIVDDKETDPLNPDSNGDGISDYQEFITCHLAGGKDC